ncbi:hypothetical protein AgCh_031017 [Apium graveolens]
MQEIAGNNYTFSNYSNALKSLMVLTQLQLNNLSVAKDVGKAFRILSGLTSDRFPTSVILIIGAVEGLVGYGVQWLVVSQLISPLPYWQMCIFLCLGGNSTTWMNTAVLVTCMRNFKNNQGPVAGILKGYLGLSTAIFTDLSTALFSSSPSSFLLSLAVIPAIICVVAALFLREAPHNSTETKQQPLIFNILNVLAFTVAFYLLAFDVTGNHGHTISSLFAFGLLVLLAAPLIVPAYFLLAQPSLTSDVEGAISEPLITQNETNIVTIAEDMDKVKEKPVIGEDHTILEALKTFDFWVLFLSFLCGVGTDVSIFVSLTSIWGFFGRIISSMASEHCIRKYSTPRPFWNAASQILMVAGYIYMALAFPGSLYIGSIVVGICYGVRLAVTVPVASELFGLKYFGLMYNVLILNLPLGSFLFSGLLAGYVYDSEATKSSGGSNTCSGSHCYRLVFVVMAFSCIVGFVLDMILAVRTRKIYAKIHEAMKSNTDAAVS